MNDEEKIEAIEKVIDEIWIDNLERVRKESDNDPSYYEHLLPDPKALLLIKEILEDN